MKKEYDFSKGKRGAIDKVPVGKVRITIRLNKEIIDWFRNQTEINGGGSYQSLINDALKAYIMQITLENTLRTVLQEEIAKLIYHIPLQPIYSQIAFNDNIRSTISISSLVNTANTSIDRRRIIYGGN